jgi:hypothetical protein
MVTVLVGCRSLVLLLMLLLLLLLVPIACPIAVSAAVAPTVLCLGSLSTIAGLYAAPAANVSCYTAAIAAAVVVDLPLVSHSAAAVQ